MKLIILLILIANINFTVQQPDLLIVNEVEIKIRHNFPLEQLTFNKRPFGYTQKNAPNTACWRGYTAQWEIQNDKLYLKSINRCYGDKKEPTTINLVEFFRSNDMDYLIENELILANWFSGRLPIVPEYLDINKTPDDANLIGMNQAATIARIVRGVVIEYQNHK